MISNYRSSFLMNVLYSIFIFGKSHKFVGQMHKRFSATLKDCLIRVNGIMETQKKVFSYWPDHEGLKPPPPSVYSGHRNFFPDIKKSSFFPSGTPV